jgi:hypothetical protein
MNLTQLDEPDLEFAVGSRHVDPRHGITDYGPADAPDREICATAHSEHDYY